MAAAKKKVLCYCEGCHQFLAGFLAKGHVPRMSLQPLLSANDKDGNEMIPRAAHRSSGIFLTPDKNP